MFLLSLEYGGDGFTLPRMLLGPVDSGSPCAGIRWIARIKRRHLREIAGILRGEWSRPG